MSWGERLRSFVGLGRRERAQHATEEELAPEPTPATRRPKACLSPRLLQWRSKARSPGGPSSFLFSFPLLKK